LTARPSGAIVEGKWCLMRTRLENLEREFGLDAIYVFGSRTAEVATAVRHDGPLTQSTSSDVDIGVLPEAGVRLDAQRRARLTIALEDVFGGARVDLVLLPEAPAFLALDIVNGELLVAADKDRVAEYELLVLRRAGDLAPFERERRRLILTGAGR
jgi:predicted nucleotidyltransferase